MKLIKFNGSLYVTTGDDFIASNSSYSNLPFIVNTEDCTDLIGKEVTVDIYTEPVEDFAELVNTEDYPIAIVSKKIENWSELANEIGMYDELKDL